jgi:hypothetical protein
MSAGKAPGSIPARPTNLNSRFGAAHNLRRVTGYTRVFSVRSQVRRRQVGVAQHHRTARPAAELHEHSEGCAVLHMLARPSVAQRVPVEFRRQSR